jgi:hypothetical protein
MTRMTKKFKILLAVLVVILFSIVFLIGGHFNYSKEYKLNVIKSEKYWCYEISLNNNPLIYQEYIPAISGKRRFPDKESAEKTGILVLGKLNHKLSPSVNINELCCLKIINCDSVLNE